MSRSAFWTLSNAELEIASLDASVKYEILWTIKEMKLCPFLIKKISSVQATFRQSKLWFLLGDLNRSISPQTPQCGWVTASAGFDLKRMHVRIPVPSNSTSSWMPEGSCAQQNSTRTNYSVNYVRSCRAGIELLTEVTHPPECLHNSNTHNLKGTECQFRLPFVNNLTALIIQMKRNWLFLSELTWWCVLHG